MKTKITIIVILGFTWIFSNCYGHHYPPEKRLNKMIKYLEKELDLTETQVAQLEQIKQKMLERSKSQRKVPFWFEDGFLSQLESGKLDKEVLKNEVRSLHAKMLENRLQDIEDLYPFYLNLSPEQRKELVELMKEHKKRFEKYYRR
ncbi:MAG: Spy/CpxP family protein refolding chaperone [Leptospiraceae bacterium]|nr:Spy/CpxP family protein refolding chaperone [Leptospiraceae bacterium]MDW7976224.1 Spy/CpxP family protein refolding chaperone [Leptospiraceae bacterium]